MKIRPVRAELFHEDGRTDVTKLTVVFRSFAKASKNRTERDLIPSTVCCTSKVAINPFKYEAQTALFKDPVRTAQ